METKVCSRCLQGKAVECFAKRSRSKDGRQAWCKECVAKNNRKFLKANPKKRTQYYESAKAKMKHLYATDPKTRETKKRRAKEWKARLPAEERKRINWESHLRHMYGLTIQEYNRLIAERNGRCACCNQTCEEFHVDHDHETGEVRGMVCRNCNSGIGLLGDNIAGLERAIAYLRKQTRAFEPLTFIA